MTFLIVGILYSDFYRLNMNYSSNLPLKKTSQYHQNITIGIQIFTRP